MTILGQPQIAQVGSITAPDHIALAFGSEISPTLKDFGLYYAIPLPSIRGSIMICHGVEAMRHVNAGASYRLGILAPQAAQTVVGTGARATSTLTFTAATQPLDGDSFQFIINFYYITITFKNTFTVGSTSSFEVKIGANLAATILNLKNLINASAVEGTDFHNGYAFGGYSQTTFRDTLGIEVSNTTATVVTFRAIAFGTAPNSWLNIEQVDGAGTWAVTNFAGGAGGSLTAPAAGEYSYAYQHYRSGDGALSGRSAIANLSLAGAMAVNQTIFVDASARFATDFFRQDRSTTGAVDLWRIQDTAIADSEPYVDAVADGSSTDVGTLVGIGAIPYEDTIYRLYAGGCPVICKYSALYKGSVWMGGADLAADITTGTVTTVTDGYSVTFSASRVCKEAIIGRTIKFSSDTFEYIICDVDESTGIAQINIPFMGTGAGGLSYVLKDKRNPNALYFSPPLLPNNFPSANVLDDITSLDPVGITGIKAAWDSLIVWTKTGVWRVYGDFTSGYRIQNIGEGMGCYSGFSIVDVEGTMFWLGRDGIFQWNGSGDPQLLSKPVSPTGTFPKGIQRTLDRINQDEADMIVSVYNPSTRAIIWACPMDGDTHNNDAIVYDTQSGAFTTDSVSSITALAAVPGADGNHVTLAGDAFGNIFQTEIDACTSDGCYGIEPVQTFSSYALATRALTLAGSPGLPTASGGLAGIPVIHVDNLGNIQLNKIISNTSSIITTAYPWTTTPSNGTFVIGGIWLDVLTAKYDFNAPNAFKWIDRTIISFVPQTKGRLYLAAGTDELAPQLFHNRTLGGTDFADLTVADGSKDFPARTKRAHRLSQRFLAFTPGHNVVLLSFETRLGVNEPVGA